MANIATKLVWERQFRMGKFSDVPVFMSTLAVFVGQTQ